MKIGKYRTSLHCTALYVLSLYAEGMTIGRPKPYIGISGVVNPNQQYYLMDHFIWQGLDEPPIDRQIALGIKAVHKTQYLDIENKYGSEWYPVGEEAFAGALENGGIEALRVAQVYFDTDLVHSEEYRTEFVDRICQRGKTWLSAIQFDLLPWHNDDSMLSWLEKVKEESGLTILLQAHGEAMEQLGSERIARKLGRYAHALDYVLFDASHGKGERMNTKALEPFLYAGHSATELSSVGFSVAGGLNAEVVRQDLPDLLEGYPGVSWDAEGQLHPTLDDGTRPLSAWRSTQYLNASAEALRERYN